MEDGGDKDNNDDGDYEVTKYVYLLLICNPVVVINLTTPEVFNLTTD